MSKVATRLCAAALLGLLCACALAAPVRSWHAIADLRTSNRKSDAEGGQTAAIVAPAGISWTSHLDAFGSGDFGPCYQLTLEFTDAAAPPGSWRIDPVREAAELVDDEGGRFPCTQVLAPDSPGPANRPKDALAHASWVLVFPVHGSYRFAAMTSIAVHWHLSFGGEEDLAITTRFRS